MLDKNNVEFRTKSQRLKILFFSLIFMSIIPGVFAAAQQEEPKLPEKITITDMRSRSISIPEDIDSIIALGAGSLRLVSYLDATDMVIAVEDSGHGREKSENDFFPLATYRLAFPELRNLPSIGGMENHEGIITASPDLIICSVVDTGQLDQLQAILGIPVFAVNVDLELYDTESFCKQLELLGKILDKQERAGELIDGINSALMDLDNRTEKSEESKQAYAGGMMFFGPADLLRTTGDYLPFDLTGTKNVMPGNPAGNQQPYMTSLEDLIAAAPDYVFIDAANVNLSKMGFESNRELLDEQVPAFRNREVYTALVYKYYGTNWENQLINVYFAGKTMYPELYADVTISDKAEEIWNLFFGVSLNYDEVVSQQKVGPEKADWFN